ncbi:uncharacterized protein LOC130147499 [Falco biarmicus]|uniref:uncharacterized protein LOC129735864 n=1 Tax=Falco cherrug TaxID=345164 RepID=UPI002478EAA5|nr:uncharacterized protein LOC129735864 [Falco cherrug]XP_055660083.1 uncharacterized protein LOC129784473 [Falco peregrinus]XP_056190702.1 uncharacterized protein LOC130147499 [Falco biarmicus]
MSCRPDCMLSSSTAGHRSAHPPPVCSPQRRAARFGGLKPRPPSGESERWGRPLPGPALRPGPVAAAVPAGTVPARGPPGYAAPAPAVRTRMAPEPPGRKPRPHCSAAGRRQGAASACAAGGAGPRAVRETSGNSRPAVT